MEPELRPLSLPQLKEIYDTELVRTFPAAELMPFSTMASMFEQGRYDTLGFFDGDTLLGYALLSVDVVHDYALIDYLGVASGRRNGGLGAILLKLVESHCDSYQGVLAEVEALAGRSPEADDLIMHRLGFYERAGFVYLPYDMSLFGVQYRVLVFSATGDYREDKVLRIHQRFYQSLFSPSNYERYVQLPLGEEPLKPCSPWMEG
jgi:GNAT superfamily N-acetyltransferase